MPNATREATVSVGPSTIGERIRQLRLQRDPQMTQRELAERAGVSVDLISKLEQGRKQTALLVSLHKIARALDVDASMLLARPSRIDVTDDAQDHGVLAIRRAITAVRRGRRLARRRRPRCSRCCRTPTGWPHRRWCILATSIWRTWRWTALPERRTDRMIRCAARRCRGGCRGCCYTRPVARIRPGGWRWRRPTAWSRGSPRTAPTSCRCGAVCWCRAR